jgi:adenylate kinase family enzyme
MIEDFSAFTAPSFDLYIRDRTPWFPAWQSLYKQAVIYNQDKIPGIVLHKRHEKECRQDFTIWLAFPRVAYQTEELEIFWLLK